MTNDRQRLPHTRLARPVLGLGVWMAAGLIVSPAQAWVLPGPLASQLGCASQAMPLAPLNTQAPTKSEAILGGKVSALEMITLQQQAMPAPASDPRPFETPVALVQTAGGACAFTPSAALLPARPIPLTPHSSEDFLGSARVTIGKTPFDNIWKRVSTRALARTRVQKILGQPETGQGLELLGLVNQWVNQNVEFTSDPQLYGKRDYWASATQTLRARKGDCEDYVILKYQMLAALGVDVADMYLTLTRDLVRNEDHTVLVVRIGDNHFMLDSATDTLLPASLSHDYRAMMTLSSRGSWVHGYTKAPHMAALSAASLSHFSDNAVSSARVTGLSK